MNQTIGVLYDSGNVFPLIEEEGKILDCQDHEMTGLIRSIFMHPWSADAVTYKSKVMDDGTYMYVCHSIAYDNLDAKIFGFGNTQTEAELDYQNRIQRILGYFDSKK